MLWIPCNRVVTCTCEAFESLQNLSQIKRALDTAKVERLAIILFFKARDNARVLLVREKVKLKLCLCFFFLRLVQDPLDFGSGLTVLPWLESLAWIQFARDKYAVNP